MQKETKKAQKQAKQQVLMIKNAFIVLESTAKKTHRVRRFYHLEKVVKNSKLCFRLVAFSPWTSLDNENKASRGKYIKMQIHEKFFS